MRWTGFVVIAFVLVGMAALTMTPALAAKGGNGKSRSARSVTSSITLDQAGLHLGDEVTFTVSYPSKVKDPRIAVRCYQDGVMTYAEAGPYGHVFLLGGAGSQWLWQGGPAECTAELFHIIWNGNHQQEVVSLAWTSFNAAE
jgi:hypothetical protein